MQTYANATAIPRQWQSFAPVPAEEDSTPLCLVGPSTVARTMREVLGALVRADQPILLCGALGTGKRQFAEELHRRRGRAAGAFRVVDPTAIATQPERAGGGRMHVGASRQSETWYVPGLDALSDSQQVALVRSLTQPATVRVIAATTADVDELLAHRRLRPDLATLLTVRVTLPPVRDRLDDLAAIAQACVHRWSVRTGAPCPDVSEIALGYLRAYTWPRNLPELDDVLVTACERTRGRTITGTMINAVLGGRPRRNAGFDVQPLCDVERRYIRIALARCGDNQSLAARRLKIGRNTLVRWLQS